MALKTKPAKQENLEDRCCGNCYFWIKDECYRYPPRMVRSRTLGTWYPVRPVVNPAEFCGEWVKGL